MGKYGTYEEFEAGFIDQVLMGDVATVTEADKELLKWSWKVLVEER